MDETIRGWIIAPVVWLAAAGCSPNHSTEAPSRFSLIADADTLDGSILLGGTLVLADASLVGAIPASSVIVDIPGNAEALGPAAYGANPLLVAAGSTVVWTNRDTVPHTATSDTLVWDSGILMPGDSFFRVFPFAGTFPYHCVVHDASRMSGTIVAREPELPDAH